MVRVLATYQGKTSVGCVVISACAKFIANGGVNFCRQTAGSQNFAP